MFAKAEGLLIEGFGKCLTSGNQYDEMHFRSTLGQLYYKKRQPTKALTYLQPGLDLAELKNNHEMLSELNFNISEVYASMGNYKKAYESYMKYHSHYDSIYNEKSVARLNELEMQYQNKKNEVEIAALRSEHAVYDLELKRDHLERSLLWAIIVFIAGSMVLLAFFYSSTRKSGKLLRQKNKQLAEAIAIKNKLFSIVAHDLKNPLNSIIGFSTLIASGQEDKESVTNYAGYIKSSGIQSFEMIERLLEWSRLNLNEIPFNIKRNDLFETVGRAAKDISNFASMKSIKINNGIKESTYCFYDENSIYSVLVNLLSNAIKFSYDNSEVSISAFKKDDFMVISVHDNGIGISNDIKEQLNGHGITQSSPGTRDEKGTGLGLSISKEFISKNGGVLLIESSEGTGTTVTFSLKANP
jgi:signal transduction histidine kinase